MTKNLTNTFGKNIFGTDGIRSKVGDENGYFSFQNLLKLSFAISNWVKNSSENSILIGYDTRNSCDWAKNIIKSALLSNGINVFDAGIIPTPTIFYSFNNNFNLGLIISASHNAYTDNGIKLISKNGKLSLKEELEISDLYFQNLDLSTINYNALGKDVLYTKACDDYIEKILKLFESEILANKKIVLDTANGATYKIAPEIFKALGAQVVTINNSPNGFNINQNCGATNTNSLQKSVLKNNADIGFAFDGDGDRVVVVNKYGEVKDGDDILAVLSNHPDYTNMTQIVGTIMSNQGLELFLKAQNKELIRSNVGDKYVLSELNKHSLSLGGEQSGHIILKNIVPTGDGILAALKICQAINIDNNWEFKTFKKYPQIFINLSVKNKPSLQESPFSDTIKDSQSKINQGRILVRYSGTENLLRIMIEEDDIKLAQKIGTDLAYKLEKDFL